MEKFYHVAPTAVRHLIEQNGLEPWQEGNDTNFPQFTGTPVVHLFKDQQKAEEFASQFADIYPQVNPGDPAYDKSQLRDFDEHPRADIWEAHTDQRMSPDSRLNGAVTTTGGWDNLELQGDGIPRENLKMVKPFYLSDMPRYQDEPSCPTCGTGWDTAYSVNYPNGLPRNEELQYCPECDPPESREYPHLRYFPPSAPGSESHLPTDYLDSREAKQWLPHPDETDEYMRGQCAAWADAHQDEYPHLRFGVDWERMTPDHPSYKDYKEDMGEDPEDGEWWRPQHYFTHDDNHWYDVEGAHPLSELPQWDRHTLNEDNVWFHGDLESGCKPDPEWVRRYAPVPKQSSSDWYHVAPKAYRESILKNGIQPNQQEGFSGSDFGDHLYGLQGHEQPVYLTKNPNFVGIDIENDPSDYDVWKVKPQKPLIADVGSLIEHGFELGDDDEMYPTKYTNSNHPELANMFPDDHELTDLDHPGVIDYTGTAAHPGGIDPEHIELANQKQSAATQNKLIEQSKDLPDQSEVLHEWPDGWSIRQPKTFLDHHREGVLMSNCYDANHPDRHWLWNQYEPDTVSTPPNNMGWTEYIDQEMNKPATRLHGDQVQTYSLRDPDNIPHMTVDPELVNAGVASNPWGALGRHNSEPKPEYLNRWKESLKAKTWKRQSAETTQQLAERLRPNTNKIVAQHPNGWTVQQPTTFADLDAIGDNMGTCWEHTLDNENLDMHYSEHPDWPDDLDWSEDRVSDEHINQVENLDLNKPLWAEGSRYKALYDPHGVPRLGYDGGTDNPLLGRHNSEPKPEYQQIWDELEPQIWPDDHTSHFEASMQEAVERYS